MLDRIVRGVERRSAPVAVYGSAGGAFASRAPILGGRTDAGRLVSPETAVEAVAVYGAIRLIASAIGGLPLKVYRDADERQEAASSRQWRLLHDQPNDEMAADEFWEIVASNLLGWGNAFLWKERDHGGIVQALWPIMSSRVQVGRTAVQGESVRYFAVAGVDEPVFETDILHIRGLSYDGHVGYSPVQLARQEIANALEMDTFRGSFWRNGMFAGGMLTHPNRLSKDAQDRLAAQIAAKSGTSRAGELLVLEEGMTLTNLTIPLADAQFVEQAKMSDLRIAQLFGLVPPHMWGQGENSRSMTYQNSEFAGQEFVKWTARPWLIRIERSVGRDPGIFPAPGPTLFPEFDVAELLRADTLSRWNTWQVGIEGGWIDAEWVQEQEHIEITRPITPPPKTPAVPPPPEPPAGPSPAEEALNRAVRALDEARERAMHEETLTRARADRPEPRIDVHAHIPDFTFPTPEVKVDVHVPEQPAPTVDARQEPPVVNMDMSQVADAIGELAAQMQALCEREMPAPVVTVNVPEQPAPIVNVNLEPDQPEQLTIDFQRNRNGAITGATITEG